ncbi:hypothetical protein [Cellulomonas alba]|uniref:Glycosyltransferase RgtA/B/C/D-like domain-containing protein n=1 Tax=Cellulomonas alba TaxID=3053467 RepID=A0ABT7SG54_9CELL|nr:hypothetical protein [Cellulomonas alba]MDM7855178.1 hypothetical protein [Cellulomonas alba]
MTPAAGVEAAARSGARARWRVVGVEAAGCAAAALMAVVVVAHLVHARAWFLFENGDAFTTALITRSLAVGQPQDWAMSPVLFLPETAEYGLLSLLGQSARTTLTLAALVTFVALYGAIRVAAGARGRVRRPVAGALTGFGFFCLLALLDGGPGRAGYQLPSMLASTTYYAGTVIATVLTVGLLRRVVDATDPRRPRGPVRGTQVALALVAALSTLTNPLYAGWATAPAALVLAGLALRRRIARRDALTLGLVLVGATAVGGVARLPLGRWIVADDSDYVGFSHWTRSLAHYGGLVTQTAGSVAGIASLVLTVGAWLACVPLGVVLLRRGRPSAGAALVALVAVVAPVVVLMAVVAAGASPERYLQPWVFLPAVALTAVPGLVPEERRAGAPGTLPRESPAIAAIGIVSALALGLVVAAAFAVPRLAPAPAADADVRCVVRWVDASGRTGAGQYWTVRAPKAEIADPRRLVQVDAHLGVYPWLTNRADRDGADVTFLVSGPRTAPWVLPGGATTADARRVDCGTYTIDDFGSRVLPLAPSRP